MLYLARSCQPIVTRSLWQRPVSRRWRTLGFERTTGRNWQNWAQLVSTDGQDERQAIYYTPSRAVIVVKFHEAVGEPFCRSAQVILKIASIPLPASKQTKHMGIVVRISYILSRRHHNSYTVIHRFSATVDSSRTFLHEASNCFNFSS